VLRRHCRTLAQAKKRLPSGEFAAYRSAATRLRAVADTKLDVIGELAAPVP